jgi:hypothetical protein
MAQTPKTPGAKPPAGKPPPPPPPSKKAAAGAAAAPPPNKPPPAPPPAAGADKKKRPSLPPLPGRTGAKAPGPPPAAAKVDPHEARRAHKRFDLAVAADVRVGDEVLAARTRNLSEGGAGLEVNQPLERGTELWLSLFLLIDEIEEEGKEPFAVQGTVAWRADLLPGKTWSVGVKFSELAEQDLGELRAFLAKLGK